MDGPRLVALKCENCGAPLPKGTPADEYECEYCHFRSKLVRPKAPTVNQPVAPVVAPTMTQQEALARRQFALDQARAQARMGRIIGVAVTLGILSVAFVIAFSQIRKHGGLGAFNMGFLIWDEVGGPPREVKLGGRTAVLGRVRTPAKDDVLYFVLVDSSNGNVIWRSQGFGDYSNGYQSTFAAPAGDRVVVSDFRSQLHVLDLATGTELQTLSMTDRAKELCTVGDEVWIQQVDDKAILVDPRTGATQEAPRPQGCPERDVWGHYPGEDPEHAPKVDGFRAERVQTQGDLGVAAGVKSPGTAQPMAVGFDPRTLQIRWKQPLPSVDLNTVRPSSAEKSALANGRFVSVYGVGSDLWRLCALDARTGDRLWDIALRDIFAVDSIEGLVLTDDYVYVNRTSSLEVHDARTGKLLGTVGRETYE